MPKKKVLSNLGEGRSFPSLQKHGNHDFSIEDTEFITDIFASESLPYISQPIVCNPGISGSWPVLSGIASNFELYRFEYLVYYYKPLVGTQIFTGTNTQTGYVGLLFCYDPNDITFVASDYWANNQVTPTKSQFVNYAGALTARPDIPIEYVIDCGKYSQERWYYVRQGETNEDLRMCDLGMLVPFVGECQNNSQLGEIYVKYKVHFKKSKVYYSLGDANRYAHYKLSGSFNGTNGWFGTKQTPALGTNMSLVFYNTSSASYFQFPLDLQMGNYMVYMFMVGSSGNWQYAANIGETPLNILAGAQNSSPTSSVGNQTVAQVAYFVTMPATSTPNQMYAFGFSNSGTQLSNITGADLFVIQIPFSDQN